MARPTEYDFARYLAAKKTVDDRALNHHVTQRLRTALATASGRPTLVLEIGAGIGTMVERLLDWELLDDRSPAVITALDAAPENVATARCRLREWAVRHGLGVSEDEDDRLALRRGDQHVAVELVASDFFAFAASQCGRRHWDLIVAHAFLDLIDLPTTLPIMLPLARSGALLYFTINFDGATILQPEIDRELDARIEALYHRAMDERTTNGKPPGDSRTGRHLFHHLRALGVEVLDLGSSDWVVFPGPNGYLADEAYFLHFIVHTIGQALHGHPDLDPAHFAAWLAERHAQIERGELAYVAHQLDLLGRAP